MDNVSQFASCMGKERFESAVLAHKVLRRSSSSKRRRDKLHSAMKAYHCAECGAYHIGGSR